MQHIVIMLEEIQTRKLSQKGGVHSLYLRTPGLMPPSSGINKTKFIMALFNKNIPNIKEL